jgi:glycerol-3-phosphate dehydrogenase
MCRSAVDFLARRSRLAFLDVEAARVALPKVVELLGKELKWSRCGWKYKQEMRNAEGFLKTFEAEGAPKK